MEEQKVAKSYSLPQSYIERLTSEAAQETLDTKAKVSASEIVRRALELYWDSQLSPTIAHRASLLPDPVEG